MIAFKGKYKAFEVIDSANQPLKEVQILLAFFNPKAFRQSVDFTVCGPALSFPFKDNTEGRFSSTS